MVKDTITIEIPEKDIRYLNEHCLSGVPGNCTHLSLGDTPIACKVDIFWGRHTIEFVYEYHMPSTMEYEKLTYCYTIIERTPKFNRVHKVITYDFLEAQQVLFGQSFKLEPIAGRMSSRICGLLLGRVYKHLQEQK